jgi:DNA topoisomerase-1
LNLKQGIVIKPKKIDCKFTLKELKSHYTEARLVQLLEERGIGRPSTFASLVDKIQERGYVTKENITGTNIANTDYSMNDTFEITESFVTREFGNEKGKLVIQPLGIIVIELLLKYFDNFFNYEYTKIMEDSLDQIARGKKTYVSLCNECYLELTNLTKDLEELKKFSVEIDEKHTLIIGKHGPVVKYIDPDNKKVSFLKVKKELDVKSLEKMQNISLEYVLDDTTKNKEAIGKYKGHDLFIKKGKYGVYAQWSTNTHSLKELNDKPIETIEYLEVLHLLEKDMLLDPSKPVGLVRELTSNLSIRTGKFGDYLFYKKPRVKKPEFLKLKDFNSDYKTCDKEVLLNWIKLTYKIEV